MLVLAKKNSSLYSDFSTISGTSEVTLNDAARTRIGNVFVRVLLEESTSPGVVTVAVIEALSGAKGVIRMVNAQTKSPLLGQEMETFCPDDRVES